jgi:hypothetical protein
MTVVGTAAAYEIILAPPLVSNRGSYWVPQLRQLGPCFFFASYAPQLCCQNSTVCVHQNCQVEEYAHLFHLM